MLEEVIPEEFYRYLGDETELEATMRLGATDNSTAQCYFKILMEGKNFRFKVHFLKLLLREVYEVSHSEKIKNKIEFAIVKDLLRLGIDRYLSLTQLHRIPQPALPRRTQRLQHLASA